MNRSDSITEAFEKEMRRCERIRTIQAHVALVFLLLFVVGIGVAAFSLNVQFIQWAAGH